MSDISSPKVTLIPLFFLYNFAMSRANARWPKPKTARDSPPRPEPGKGPFARVQGWMTLRLAPSEPLPWPRGGRGRRRCTCPGPVPDPEINSVRYAPIYCYYTPVLMSLPSASYLGISCLYIVVFPPTERVVSRSLQGGAMYGGYSRRERIEGKTEDWLLKTIWGIELGLGIVDRHPNVTFCDLVWQCHKQPTSIQDLEAMYTKAWEPSVLQQVHEPYTIYAQVH